MPYIIHIRKSVKFHFARLLRSYTQHTTLKILPRSIIDVSVESVCTTYRDLTASVRAYLSVKPDWLHLFPAGLIAFPTGNGKQMTDIGKTSVNWWPTRGRKRTDVNSQKY